MKHDFLANTDLIGYKFYNTEEYREHGIIYEIIDQYGNNIDIKWPNIEHNQDDYSDMKLSQFISDLNSGFFVLIDFPGFNENPFDNLD